MIPRESLDTDSIDYAKRTASHMQSQWEGVEITLDQWQRLLREADDNRVWKTLGFSNLDAMLQEYIGCDAVTSCSRQRNIDAAKATTGQVLPVGRLDDNVIAKLAITTQADRSAGNGISVAQQKKLDKLAREAPNLLRQVQAGERSCHSACIEAGFVKVDIATSWRGCFRQMVHMA